MAGTVAIIAGAGRLPGAVAEAAAARGLAPVLWSVPEFPPDETRGFPSRHFRVERLALLLRELAEAGVEAVVFAGAVRRPRLDPALFDPETAALVPRILPALSQGDDALLRAVIGLFEDAGLRVVGAHELAPALLAPEGIMGAVEPAPADRNDIARAREIVAALGAVDAGQAAVVAGGMPIGIETIAGTDHMLDVLARMPHPARPERPGGVLWKAPKPGQDLRVDMPAVGPGTVRRAAAAGLAGIAVAAGGVLALDRAEMIAEADRLGLFLMGVGDSGEGT